MESSWERELSIRLHQGLIKILSKLTLRIETYPEDNSAIRNVIIWVSFKRKLENKYNFLYHFTWNGMEWNTVVEWNERWEENNRK